MPFSFNPRAHTGRDAGKARPNHRKAGFNPRAHTGRDRLCCYIDYRHPRFNPRAHTGRDEYDIANTVDYRMFQSTRPHGARLGL